MKGDHLPIIQALKGKIKPKAESPTLPFENPRTFELQHSEIPGLPGRRVGEPITVNLHGHIQSQHNDGHTVMHVASVKPDSEEMDAKENPETQTDSQAKEVRVRTQQSHA